MKIVYLIHQFYPEFWTGTEKVVFNISSMMQKDGHGTNVITYSFIERSSFEKDAAEILYREHMYRGIRVTALQHKRIPEKIHIALGDRTMTRIAEQLLSEEKPDIIHAGHPMRVNEFIFVAQSLRIPYIITLTDYWLLCPKVNLINSRGDLCGGPENGNQCARSCPEFPSDFITQRLKLANAILLGARMVVVASRFLVGIFKNEFNDVHLNIVPHGISYNTLKLNKRSPNKGDTIIFCYIGSLNYHKGVHILVSALKEIKSSNVLLKIYGSGPDRHYMNTLLAMADGDSRIDYCGAFPEGGVGDIISNSDVVIMPSICYESYPLVLHEALACHTPVVASNIGGMAEKIIDDVNGFTFPPGDVDCLKVIMERIISDPDILNNLKGNIKGVPIPTIEQEAYAYHKIYAHINNERKNV